MGSYAVASVSDPCSTQLEAASATIQEISPRSIATFFDQQSIPQSYRFFGKENMHYLHLISKFHFKANLASNGHPNETPNGFQNRRKYGKIPKKIE